MLSIVVAISRNNIIGRNGKLPWYLPNDLKKFKEITTGHTIIMGRKTFLSLPHILPDRHHIVVTRDRSFKINDDRVTIYYSVEELLSSLELEIEYFAIGGSEIFKELMNYTDRMYVTTIHEDFEGDVYFPEGDFLEDWDIVFIEEGIVDDKNKYPHTFFILEKVDRSEY